MIFDKASFGQFLQDARIKKSIPQFELSKKLGYSSPQYVSNWERGICGPPMEKLHELCKILSIEPELIVKRIMSETESWLRSELRLTKKR